MRDVPFATSATVTPVQSPLWRPRKRYLPPAPGLPCPALRFRLPHAWRRGGSSVDPAQRHTPLLPFLGYPAISFELIFSLLPSPSPPRPAPPQETQALSCELSTPSWGHSCGVLTRSGFWAGVSGQVCQGGTVCCSPGRGAGHITSQSAASCEGWGWLRPAPPFQPSPAQTQAKVLRRPGGVKWRPVLVLHWLQPAELLGHLTAFLVNRV